MTTVTTMPNAKCAKHHGDSVFVRKPGKAHSLPVTDPISTPLSAGSTDAPITIAHAFCHLRRMCCDMRTLTRISRHGCERLGCRWLGPYRAEIRLKVVSEILPIGIRAT